MNTETNTPQRELTPEEITQRKQELLDYYSNQKELMTAQLDYETTATGIDEQRYKRAVIQLKHMELIDNTKQKEQPKTSTDL